MINLRHIQCVLYILDKTTIITRWSSVLRGLSPFFEIPASIADVYTATRGMKRSFLCAHSRPDALVRSINHDCIAPGSRQHEESSLDVNALAVARNHIRHEQAALPREFTSAGLRFRHGERNGEWQRTNARIDEASVSQSTDRNTYTDAQGERGSCCGNFDANYYRVPYRSVPHNFARTWIDCLDGNDFRLSGHSRIFHYLVFNLFINIVKCS